MREILFKAKRVDNGEWVEGYYSYNVDDDIHIIYTTADRFAIEVVGETVCQYTGLRDRNGKMIWEGDKCENFSQKENAVVFENGAFGYNVYLFGFISYAGNTNFKFDIESKSNFIEITGNIHD